MGCLYVCNTSSDNISVVDTEKFKEECKIPLQLSKLDRVGPHGICTYKDKLLVANNYSHTISVIDTKVKEEVNSFFIGMHCNDAVVFEDKAYVICGESNYVAVFNLINNTIEEEIPCGDLPHSIDINKQKKIIVVSNFHNDSLTIIDLEDKSNIINVRVGAYPTKALFTVDGSRILICESNLGGDIKGSVSVLSLKEFKLLNKILVGKYPVDIYPSSPYSFVTNFGDGSISIVDIDNYKEIKKISVGGMPRGIVKISDYLYVTDSYNNLLIAVNIDDESKKVISIGGEPNGMTYI